MVADTRQNGRNPPNQKRDWSTRRWMGVVAAVFVVQLTFISLLSAKPEHKSDHLTDLGTGICLLTAIDQADPHAELFVMRDPANNALVSSNGFSGRLWFGLTDVGQDRPAIAEPYRWLQPDQISIQIKGSRGQPQVDSTPLQIPLVRPVPPEIGGVQIRPLLTNSTIRLEGNLARRQLLNPPALPTWEFTDVLLPTSVQVLLDEYGHVINATLLSRSGLAAADERALEFVRGLTFARANDASSGGLEWGIITFVWMTREPAPVSAPAPSSTNASPPVS